MSAELNRKVAELVMGEPEPPKPTPEMDTGTESKGGNWSVVKAMPGFRAGEWEADDFSGNLDRAMRAVDRHIEVKGLENIPNDFLMVSRGIWGAPEEMQWTAYFSYPHTARGRTLPEAICNLLLESSGREDGEG